MDTMKCAGCGCNNASPEYFLIISIDTDARSCGITIVYFCGNICVEEFPKDSVVTRDRLEEEISSYIHKVHILMSQ